MWWAGRTVNIARPLARPSTQGFLVAQLVKNLPAVRETWVQSLGWEDPLEKGTTPNFSSLACRIKSRTWLSFSSPGVRGHAPPMGNLGADRGLLHALSRPSGLRAGGWGGGPGQFEDCTPQSSGALSPGAHQPGPGRKAAMNLFPVSASMTRRQQQSTWAAVPRYLGSWRIWYWPIKRASPASVSPFTFPHLVQCWSVVHPQEVAGRLGLVYKGLAHHYLRLASIVGAPLKEANCELGINPIGICYKLYSPV